MAITEPGKFPSSHILVLSSGGSGGKKTYLKNKPENKFQHVGFTFQAYHEKKTEFMQCSLI